MGWISAIPLVLRIVENVVPAIKTVERMFRGGKRGGEKKEAVVFDVLGSLQELIDSFDQYDEYELSGITKEELLALLEDPEGLADDIAALNDALVALLKRVGVLE